MLIAAERQGKRREARLETYFERITSAACDAAVPATGVDPIRILICTTPRTAGLTLCRAMHAAGLGVPTEYFTPEFARRFYARWLSLPGADLPTMRESGTRYGEALLRNRTLNGIFAGKIFLQNLDDARQIIGLPAAATRYVRLRRRDLAAQTISLAATVMTRRPFDDATELRMMPHLPVIDDSAITKLFRWICEQERDWSNYLAEIDPAHVVQLETEALLADPVAAIRAIAGRFGGPIDVNGLDLPSVIGRRYSEGGDLKQRLADRYGDLLDRLIAAQDDEADPGP